MFLKDIWVCKANKIHKWVDNAWSAPPSTKHPFKAGLLPVWVALGPSRLTFPSHVIKGWTSCPSPDAPVPSLVYAGAHFVFSAEKGLPTACPPFFPRETSTPCSRVSSHDLLGEVFPVLRWLSVALLCGTHHAPGSSSLCVCPPLNCNLLRSKGCPLLGFLFPEHNREPNGHRVNYFGMKHVFPKNNMCYGTEGIKQFWLNSKVLVKYKGLRVYENVPSFFHSFFFVVVPSFLCHFLS